MSEADSNPTVRREAALLAGAICHACGHGRSSHADRSGLCGVEGCRCEGMPNAFTHEVYPDPLLGGMAGYQAACHTCPWRGRAGSSKPEAWDEALTHGHEMEFQTEAHESISVYAARMACQRDRALHQREIARRSRDDAENHAATAESENTHLSRERDIAVNALKQIIAEFDDVDQDPVLHLARAALRQIAEPWTRADQSVRLP